MPVRTFLLTLVFLSFAATAAAQTCCEPAYRTVYKTVYDYQPVTAYRLEYETVFEERQVTVQRPVWETEYRERRYTVARPVIETSEREERYTVMRPIWEETTRDCSYDQVRYVTETEMREQRYVVQRPVVEETYQDQQRIVRKAVTDTVVQDYNYTTYEPVTTMRTEYVDQGSYVNSYVYMPGRERNRLQWLAGGYAVDPLTGVTYWRRAGLYWVPTATAGTYAVQQQYVPNVVAMQRPETTYAARVVTEKRPVQVTRYVDEVVTEKVPVKVCRMEQTEEVRQIPITVQKPVVERINYKIPVKTCRWVEQEMVRKVPVTTQRIAYEERAEQIPVQVCKWITENQTVQEPRTVAAWKPYEAQQCVPRTVVMRVPLDPCYSDLPTTTYYYPGASVPALPSAPSGGATIRQRVPIEAEAEQPERSVLKDSRESKAAQPAEESKAKAEAPERAESPAAGADKPAAEPKDTDPTGTPLLRLEDLKLSPPDSEKSEATAQPAPGKSV